MLYEGQLHIGMEMPLSSVEVVYQDILDTIVDPDPSSSLMEEENLILEPIWVAQSSCSCCFLDDTLPLYEDIL
jgi:hypothetical protein